MRVKRILLFFLSAFGSILIPVGGILLWGILTYQPPYAINVSTETQYSVLQTKLAAASSKISAVRIDESPEYPDGTKTIRVYFKENGHISLHLFSSAQIAQESLSSLFQTIPTNSSTTYMNRYITYKRSDNKQYGAMFCDGPWLLISEARMENQHLQQLEWLPFLHKQDSSTFRSLIENHLSLVLAGIGLYSVFILLAFTRMGSWAARIERVAGIAPLSLSSLHKQICSINSLDVPFAVTKGKADNELIVEWKYNDVRWSGLMAAGGVKSLIRVKLRLDKTTQTVQAQDNITRVGWGVGFSGGIVSAKVTWSVKRGINFLQYDSGFIGGLIITQDGSRSLAPSYSWRFDINEMKNPLIEIITGAGWDYVPVVTFWRFVNG